MRKLIIVISVFVFLCALGAVYLFFTNSGSRFAFNTAVSRILKPKKSLIKGSRGSLLSNLSFQDIELQGLHFLPEENEIKIQKLDFGFDVFGKKALSVFVHNARLKIPAADTIYISGKYENDLMDLNIYSKRVNLKEMLELFVKDLAIYEISGLVNNIDLYIRNSIVNPQITGELLIDRLARDDIVLKDCPVKIDLGLEKDRDRINLKGRIYVSSGSLTVKNVNIAIKQGGISFSGDAANPGFDLKGSANVESVKINIFLKGTIDEPVLRLFSEPPLPEYQLLMMLFTGKSWRNTAGASAQQKISREHMAGFIDYFLLGNSASDFARKLGISDVNVKFDGQTRGIEAKKEITENIGVLYGIKQSQTNGQQPPDTSHKVGGSYKIGEAFSVEAQKGIAQDKTNSASQEESKKDDKIMLKLKKEF